MIKKNNKSDKDNQNNPDHLELKKMSFSEHFYQLRKRLIYSFIAILLVFFICLNYNDILLDVFKKPLNYFAKNQYELSYISITEPFIASLKISILSAIILCSPIWLYQVWKFLTPALFSHEKKVASRLFLASLFLFWLGIIFCFYILLPLSLNFLINWGDNLADFDLTLSNYLSFFSSLIIGFGLVFEIPLIIILLGYLGIISPQDLTKLRRYIILACFIIAAILTPPDWISQISMAIPLYILYEISLLTIKIMTRNK